MHDLRLALRHLRRSPGFTALAVGVLALGIGANAALYSVVRAALLRPLPYPNAERLVSISGPSPMSFVQNPKPALALAPWLQQMRTVEVAAVVSAGEVNLAGGAEPERIAAAEVSSGFFAVLGVTPAGREFSGGEYSPGQDRAVIVGADFARRFGGARTALGHRLRLNGRDFTVAGVMPEAVGIPRHTQIWLPLPEPFTFDANVLDPGSVSEQVLGRLRAGVTPAAARAEVNAIAVRLNGGKPVDAGPFGAQVAVTPWRVEQEGDAAHLLWMLLASAGLVVLIAAADVAHLQLARATARQREIAVRTALGAGRRHLLRTCLAESLVLAALGGGVGVMLAYLALPALRALLPPHVYLNGPVVLDANVLAFAAAVSLASGLIFGLFPVLHAFGVDLRQAMSGAGTGTTERGWLARARSGLVVVEVALALVLLAGAGLLLVSLARLSEVNVGFQPEHLLTAHVQLSEPRYGTPVPRIQFFREVETRLAALPGVRAAAVSNYLPLTSLQGFAGVQTEEPSRATPKQRQLLANNVSPGYFRVMGIPVVAGRDFTAADREGAPAVAILSQSATRRLWPGQSAVGKHISTTVNEKNQPVWAEVVGVVGDTRVLPDSAPFATIYAPLADSSAAGGFLIVRGGAGLGPAALRAAVHAVDANEPVSDFASMAVREARANADPRFQAALFAIFGGLALVLSAAGVFGAFAYWVERRRPEIGVRLALGATPGAVAALVLRQALGLAAIGAGLGLAAALAAGRLLASQLFGVAWYNPAVLVAALVVILGVAALAAYLPARRAAATDPLIALRAD